MLVNKLLLNSRCLKKLIGVSVASVTSTIEMNVLCDCQIDIIN